MVKLTLNWNILVPGGRQKNVTFLCFVSDLVFLIHGANIFKVFAIKCVSFLFLKEFLRIQVLDTKNGLYYGNFGIERSIADPRGSQKNPIFGTFFIYFVDLCFFLKFCDREPLFGSPWTLKMDYIMGISE